MNDNDHFAKVLEIFANTMGVAFFILFCAYCTSPVWMPFMK